MKIYIKRIKIIKILIFCFFVKNSFGMDQKLESVDFFNESFRPSIDNYTSVIKTLTQVTEALDAKLEKISSCSLFYKTCLKDTEPEYVLVMQTIQVLGKVMPLDTMGKKIK